MKAMAARWESQELRLWTGSALAALLVHLAPAAILILYTHWHPRSLPLADASAALNAELASMPSAASPADGSPRQTPLQPQTRQAAANRAQPAAVNPVRPLGAMQSIPQRDVVPSNAVPVAGAGAIGTPVESSDLGAPGAPDPGLQLWEDEIVARLASYKDYPSSALQALQQDTVTLQISVDHAGQVTYSRIDSAHHYQALEQEVQQMLRLAGRLPSPPPQLSEDAVVTVPVQFYLDFRSGALCSGSGCLSADDAHDKAKAVAPPAPTLASCSSPADPGPGTAPAGSTATAEQMRTYRERLNQYLAANGNQLACLSQVRETSTLALRGTLTRQMQSMVDGFNAQVHVFQASAQARALQAQQARQRLAQALATQVYAKCTPPPPARAPGTLTAQGAPAFRRQVVAYQAAVRSYVACLRQADLAATASDRGLAGDQRAQLDHTALQLGDAAILSFNQLAGRFNAQVPHLRQQALAAQAQETLTEAIVQGTAIFPDSTWSAAAPLPTGECFSITRVGQTYHAQLCSPTYVTTASGVAQLLKSAPLSSDSAAVRDQKIEANLAADSIASEPGMVKATQQEAIFARHGFPYSKCRLPPCGQPIVGIAVAPQAGVQIQSASSSRALQTTFYSISELQVAGRHLSLTISGRSDNPAGGVDLSAMHFDLVLSPDNQTLHGYCLTQAPGGGQERRQCTLGRQR